MSHLGRFAAVLAAVGVLVVAATIPASAAPDNMSHRIVGQGSDTTVFMMEALDKAYLDASLPTTGGCQFISSPQRLDHVCAIAGPPYVTPADPTGATFENFNRDSVTSLPFLGSGNGISMLNKFGQVGFPRIDYARSSRGRTGSDNPGLRFVAYARDALTWVDFRGSVDPSTCAVDRSSFGANFDDDGPLGHSFGNNTNGPGTANPTKGTWPDANGDGCPDATPVDGITNLTQQQLKNIFINCQTGSTPGVEDWHDINSAVPQGISIVVWTAQPGSGTRSTWDGFMGGSSDTCIPSQFKDANFANGERVVPENDATPIRGCTASGSCPGTNPATFTGGHPPIHYTQSIFPFSFGQYQVSPSPHGQGSSLGSVDGVTPTPTTIANGTFPFGRYLFNVYRNNYPDPGGNNAPDWVRDYVGENGWICKVNSKHGVDPKTGVNYGTEIDNIITANGFVPGPFPSGSGGTTVPNSKCLIS